MKNAYCTECHSEACEHATSTRPARVILTARERQIIGLAGQALAIKEMAWALGTSQKTVQTQLSALYVKLGFYGGAGLRLLGIYAVQHPEVVLEVAP